MKDYFGKIEDLHRKTLDKILKKYVKIFGAEYIEVLYNDIRNQFQEEGGCTPASAYIADVQTRRILGAEKN